MQFISVKSINAQFSVNVGASAGAGEIGAGAVGDAGASIGYSESPTITFVPELGRDYFESLYGALSVNELVAFVIMDRYVPSDVDWEAQSLSMIFASVNGASDIVKNQVMHRGFCFYVDDTDVGSKQILEGLVSIYVSRIGGVSGRGSEPQVVIPVG